MVKAFFKLIKPGICIFVMVTGLAGYAMSLPVGVPFEILEPALLLVGLFLISAGSFALNQAQEWRIDQKMKRTSGRPIPTGTISSGQAYSLAGVMVAFGYLTLFLLNPLSAHLALLTVFLYNVLYTLYWKKKWAFAAVPGALPGAMPVVIGYAANNGSIFQPDCFYLFLIMFLWQMPHFWALAVRFKEDYKSGGIPILPNQLGEERTLYHIGLYVFAYIGVALSVPWFIHARLTYLLLVVPLSIKILIEFYRYFHAPKQKWLPFFLWVNLSMLAFVCIPVFDKWVFYYLNAG